MEFIQPYNVGDRVKVIRPGSFGSYYKNHLDIIDSVNINDINDYEYSLTGTAWWRHDQLERITERDMNSLQELLKIRDDNNDGEDL